MKTPAIIDELASIRKSLGITQNQLSIKLGYSIHCIQRWESGTSSPMLNSLLNWCEGLGMLVSIDPIHLHVIPEPIANAKSSNEGSEDHHHNPDILHFTSS